MSTLDDLRNDRQNSDIVRFLNALEPMVGSDSTLPTVPNLGVSTIKQTAAPQLD